MVRLIDGLTGTETKIEELPVIARKISKLKGVKAVYLFGSQATGKTHQKSDIDLCIIGEKFEDDELEGRLLEFITDNLDVVYFWRLPLIFQFRVFNDGRALIIKDKNFILKIKSLILRKYIDFLPAINKFVSRTLNVR